MANTTITSIQFKRGTKKALEAKLIGDKKPLYGEPVWETDTNRLKIGDGKNNYVDLPYLEGSELFLEGFYDKEHDVFWKDELHNNPYPRYTSKIYKDLKTELYYYLKDNKYILMFEIASSTNYGVSKLYDKTGQNSDGSVTQKGLTDALNSIVNVYEDDELLKIKSDF